MSAQRKPCCSAVRHSMVFHSLKKAIVLRPWAGVMTPPVQPIQSLYWLIVLSTVGLPALVAATSWKRVSNCGWYLAAADFAHAGVSLDQSGRSFVTAPPQGRSAVSSMLLCAM